MKRNKQGVFICLIIVAFCSITIGIYVFCLRETAKKEDSPITLECMKIPTGQTRDVILNELLYSGNTPRSMVSFAQSDSRYSGGYINDEGKAVVLVNQEQAEYWFNLARKHILDMIEIHNTEPIRVEVSQNCDTIYCYVGGNTTLKDLSDSAVFFMVADCIMVQTYAGITYEDVGTSVQIIYGETDEVMYNLSDGEDYHFTEEDWNKKLEEMKSK